MLLVAVEHVAEHVLTNAAQGMRSMSPPPDGESNSITVSSDAQRGAEYSERLGNKLEAIKGILTLLCPLLDIGRENRNSQEGMEMGELVSEMKKQMEDLAACIYSVPTTRCAHESGTTNEGLDAAKTGASDVRSARDTK